MAECLRLACKVEGWRPTRPSVGRGLPPHTPHPTHRTPHPTHRTPHTPHRTAHSPQPTAPPPTAPASPSPPPPPALPHPLHTGGPLRAGKHALALLVPKDDGKKAAPGKKGPAKKVVAKTGGALTQWDILRSMGLAVADIPPFVDASYWLRYFPPLGKQDLQRFGCGIDWRRTFITTDYNAFYDTFVRWQFSKLRAANVIAFGKRPSIYSESDGQPCMDHDRDKGEGVGNQKYTAIKIRVLEPFPAALQPLAGKQIFCLAGTLRPETMCGQTNAWILPEGDYAAFDAGGDIVYVCAPRAARNMGFQDLLPHWGTPTPLLSFKGKALIGAALHAPSTSYGKIYMLPLTTISMTKGTAIVTSVPSDSPDDYAAFMDLKNPKKREFYGVEVRRLRLRRRLRCRRHRRCLRRLCAARASTRCCRTNQ